jgi:hypothetical protein
MRRDDRNIGRVLSPDKERLMKEVQERKEEGGVSSSWESPSCVKPISECLWMSRRSCCLS